MKTSVARIDDLIVYGLVPRNMGTDGLRSVAARLPDIADLGVNAIWLSPINVSPPGDFGYAVVDYFKLRPEYGTEADFKALVQTAHLHGIAILMDFVPNHTSDQHPYFVDAQARGSDSPYYTFYDRDGSGAPTHYFDWQHLPNLNYDNPTVQEWMLDAFTYWVHEFDVDGFRVDAAWGIKQRRPDFWPRWRAALTAIKPDLFLLTEASARDPYYFDHGFDAGYDWTDELGHWAWEHVFEAAAEIVPRLHAALTNEGRGYHPQARIFRFLNNNDTGPRFITRYGLGMTRVAAALLLTLPGIPCVYMGEEVGAEYEPYKQAGPIAWEDRHGLRPYYKQLIALRTSLPELRSRHWRPVSIRGAAQVYGYLRGAASEEEPLLVLLNWSDSEAQPEVELPEQFQRFAERPLVDLLSDERMGSQGQPRLRVPLAPWSARILRTFLEE